MISKRLQFMKDADLRGELLEVINAWQDCVDSCVCEQDRLRLMDMLADYLAGKI